MAEVAGMRSVAGTGASVGLEHVRLTTAPAGAALLSWTVTISSSPLKGAGRVRLRPVTLGGAGLTVKLATVEKAVTAGGGGVRFPRGAGGPPAMWPPRGRKTGEGGALGLGEGGAS